MLKQKDSSQRQFSPSCNFQKSRWEFDDSARSLVRKIVFVSGVLVSFVLRTLTLWLSLSLMHRGWWASVSAHFWTPGTFSGFVMLTQQQSEPLVEEWKMLTTIRTIGRRAESVAGCKQVFFVCDGCCYISVHVPTSFCCCERQPVVLRDENWLPRECFCFVLQDSC